MENYEEVDKKHYDSNFTKYLKKPDTFSWRYGSSGVNPNYRTSYQFIEDFISKNIHKGNKILDYGCGSGVHSINLAKMGYKVTGIDTLGHNPIANTSRRLKLWRGLRTKKTVNSILKNKDIKIIKQHFPESKFFYFHLIILLFAPLKKQQQTIVFLDKIDSFLLKFNFLKKYSFKVVWICKKNKDDQVFRI